MGLSPFILMLACYALLGVAAYVATRDLSSRFPFYSKSKFWWTKYIPGLGFTLILMAADRPLSAHLPGLIILVAGGVWMTYCQYRDIRSEPRF